MVVRVFDSSDEYDNDCDESYSYGTTPSNTSESSSNEYAASNTRSNNAFPAISLSLSCKNLVGNFKEFRIENNKSDLRIIGNGNRIRISNNSGNLYIIGNNSRLKITHNSGQIKYTGNEGRIRLGSDSTQQMVDYIGCNGILKIINLVELNDSSKNPHKAKSNARDAKKMPSDHMNMKTASNGGDDGCKSIQWKNFADFFQRRSNKMPPYCALPNTVYQCCECGCSYQSKPDSKRCQVNNNINVEKNVCNVVIKNSVDVRI